jgi:hypothetical protein
VIKPPVPFRMLLDVIVHDVTHGELIGVEFRGDLRGRGELRLEPDGEGTLADVWWRFEIMQRGMRAAARPLDGRAHAARRDHRRRIRQGGPCQPRAADDSRATAAVAGEATPVLGLLFFHNADYLSHPLSEEIVRTRFPHAHEYMQEFSPILRWRSKFRNFDPSGSDWLGLYSVTQACIAQDKVMIRDIARGTIAASVHGADVIPDHTLNVIPCTTAKEADLLATVINSNVVHYLARSFSVAIWVTASFLRYVGIKDLSAVEIDGDQHPVAEALGLANDELAD